MTIESSYHVRNGKVAYAGVGFSPLTKFKKKEI